MPCNTGEIIDTPVFGICCGCSAIAPINKWPVGRECVFEADVTAPSPTGSGVLGVLYYTIGLRNDECQRVPWSEDFAMALDAGVYEYSCENIGNYSNSSLNFYLEMYYNTGGLPPEYVFLRMPIPEWDGSSGTFLSPCVGNENRKLRWSLRFSSPSIKLPGSGSSVFRITITKIAGEGGAP